MRPSKQELVDVAAMLADSPTRISFLRAAAEFWSVNPQTVRNWYHRCQTPVPGVLKNRQAFVPDLQDLLWAWNYCNPAPTHEDLLERVGAYYGVHAMTVTGWTRMFQDQAPQLTGPRGPYKKD